MFDIGFWELAVIGLIALLVLGPERLPKAARTAGLWVGRARRMLSDVKSDIDREIRASELKEIAEVKDLKSSFENAAREVTDSTRAVTEFANQDVTADTDKANTKTTATQPTKPANTKTTATKSAKPAAGDNEKPDA